MGFSKPVNFLLCIQNPVWSLNVWININNDAGMRAASETHQNIGANMLTYTLELLQGETFQNAYIKIKALTETKVI